MFFRKNLITLVSVVMIIVFLCVPLLWAKDDEERPPEKEPLPTYAESVQVFIF